MYHLRSMSRKTRSFHSTKANIGLHNVCKLENSLKQFKKVKNKDNKDNKDNKQNSQNNQNKDNNKSIANTKYEFVCIGFAGYAVVEKK